jgi:O-Antigen ligase
MEFFLFVLVNAALFIRPSELSPELASLEIYQYLILAGIAVAFPKIAAQLTPQSLAARPITACVVGLLFAVVMSHVSHLFFWGARYSGFEFLKVLLYFLLLITVIDSVERLRRFLFWLAAFTMVLSALAVLQHHGLVDIIGAASRQGASFDRETGRWIEVTRISSTGIFNDPNDLAMILVLAMAISVYWLTDPRFGPLALFSLAPIALFGYAFAHTHSRGGMLALLAAVVTFAGAKYGWRRALPLGVVAVPLLIAAFAGRQTDFGEGIGSGTGMQRIQLWSMGLSLLRQDLLFGIGYGTFADQLGHVAHNSYVNAFTELGLFGGSLFLGAFLIAITGLWQIGSQSQMSAELSRLRPFLLAIVVGYGAAMFSLSREGMVPTYMVLGLAAATLSLAERYGAPALPRFNQQLIMRLAMASVCFVFATYIFVRVFARWG